MRTRLSIFTAALFMAFFLALPNPARAQALAALTGRVSSAKEGAMEGVIVSAKKAGATITVSVVSDAMGYYSFPAAKLEPGQYTLAIRAIGFELEGPKSADVAAASPTSVDITLRATKSLSMQLSNGEWLASLPGSESEKKVLLNCVSCH